MSLNGILGLGTFSTQYYLAEIQRIYKGRNKVFSTCPYLLYQIDFQEINPFLPNQYPLLIPKIESILNKISDLGISKLLVPNITLHETLDKIESDVELYHPVDLTINYLAKNNISKVILFGTLYTMNAEYLKHKFSKNKVEIILPSTENQVWIDQFRKKVFNQTYNKKEIEYYRELLQFYAKKSPVVIGCTELSVFSLKNNTFCIDMADLQIQEFLK